MKKIALFLFTPMLATAFETKPWFGNVYEFNLLSSFTYSRYTHIQNAHPQLKHPSNNQLFTLGLEFSPSEYWDTEILSEFAETSRQAWSFWMGGAQVRKIWWDDIIGDPLSVATGLTLFGVTGHALSDVSCPYHASFNAELSASFGKEWSQEAFWRLRTYGFIAFGFANKGSPWTKAKLLLESNSQDRRQYGIFAEGYAGFGSKREVDPSDFHGYANVKHRSLDVGIHYRVLFSLWGELTFQYAHRFYARSFPENVNSLMVSYKLPFSLF